MDSISLGKGIKNQRKAMALTQQQLAEVVNLSTVYIGQVERGERMLSLPTLVSIANTLQSSLDFLLSDSICLKCKEGTSSYNTEEPPENVATLAELIILQTGINLQIELEKVN